MKKNHHAGSATGIDLAALSTYDPDRDTPGMMELRDTYKDGDYYKVEDVQAALARATPQHPGLEDDRLDNALANFLAEHTRLNQDGIDTHAMTMTLALNYAALKPVSDEDIAEWREQGYLDATPQHSVTFPERDQSKPAEQQGMFRKFNVSRVDGSDVFGGKHFGCRYYVFDLTHDQHAPEAMRAYAAACASTHPQLAADIVAEFGAQHSVTEQASMPGDWQVEFDAYSAPGTIRLNSPKWGGCFLGAPKRGDIELPALVYHLLSDMLAQPQASTAATQPEQAALVKARDAINGLLWQFTATPSTYRDSNARAQGHEAVKAIDAALTIPASTAASEQQAGCRPGLLNADELAALRRFDECAQDGEGYDVPQEMMQRLAEIGVVRRKSGRYYQATEFGQAMLAATPDIATTAADQQGDTARASIEPERMTIDQSKQYLIGFMERHFKDKTFHSYIKGGLSRATLAGDFSWELARALRIIAQQGAALDQAGDMVRDLVKLWDAQSVSADDYNDAMCGIEARMRTFAAMAAPATSKATDE